MVSVFSFAPKWQIPHTTPPITTLIPYPLTGKIHNNPSLSLQKKGFAGFRWVSFSVLSTLVPTKELSDNPNENVQVSSALSLQVLMVFSLVATGGNVVNSGAKHRRICSGKKLLLFTSYMTLYTNPRTTKQVHYRTTRKHANNWQSV